MSEIWNEFEKIALEQGLITEAQEDKRQERSQEDPAKMPARYDSLSNDAIRMLYGLEPEKIFEKGKTIIEVAHPETAIAGRAYDAMNAVWENEHQRHDMMSYIALKMPNGHLTQRRYVAAKQDLVNALVRSAFTLDHEDEHELMSLADSCAERLVKRDEEIKKEAIAPLAIAGIAAGAALLGAAWYVSYGPQTAQNVYINSQQVLESLDKLSDQPYADGIRTDVQKIMDMAEAVYADKDQLGQVISVDAAVTAAQSAAHKAKVDAINKRIQTYINQLRKVQRAIPNWVKKIQSVNSTSTEGSSDWWAKVKGIFDPVYDTKTEDLINKLYGKEAWLGMQKWLGLGTARQRSGGLYEAITKDIQKMGQAMVAAKQEVEQKAPDIFQQPAPAQQLPPQMVAQAPKPAPAPAPAQTLPAPTPAPAPTMPGAGAARTPVTGLYGAPVPESQVRWGPRGEIIDYPTMYDAPEW